jgi:hypothetical protein
MSGSITLFYDFSKILLGLIRLHNNPSPLEKLHWTLLLCAQLQDDSGFVIFQENKSLVAGFLSSLHDNTVVSLDGEVAQPSPFFSSFLFEKERMNMNM